MGVKKKFFEQAGGLNATDHFDIKTYTGPSTSITGLSFQPDLALLGSTSDTDGNHIIDSVRGVKNTLFPNLVQSELVRNSVTAFNSDGVTLGDYASLNHTGVSWFWKAGGTASTNSDGAVNINLSANADAGFSIGTRTGKHQTADTVGHGLGKAPEFVIMRARNVDSEWLAWFPSINGSQYLRLNSTDGFKTNAAYNPTVTSTTFTVNWTNTSYDWIYYFWTSIDGFSKMGSYSGSSTGGKSITGLGFQPRFVLIKRTSSDGGAWMAFDSVRGALKPLRVNTNSAVSTESNTLGSFDSDGFTLDGQAGGVNLSGATYAYFAIA